MFAGIDQHIHLVASQEWRSNGNYIYTRLSHDVPAFHGVRLGTRVGMAERADQATHLIAPDGSVRPNETSP